MTNQDPDRDKRLADIERRIKDMQARQNQEEKKRIKQACRQVLEQ